VAALLPGVVASPPNRWKRLLGDGPSEAEIERVLDRELERAFGSAEDVFHEMKVNVVFKGVTYESPSDAEFIDMCWFSPKWRSDVLR